MTNAQKSLLTRIKKIYDLTKAEDGDLIIAATIEDRETDPFQIFFNVDRSIRLETGGNDYMFLDAKLLGDIMEMAEQVPDLYEEWDALT